MLKLDENLLLTCIGVGFMKRLFLLCATFVFLASTTAQAYSVDLVDTENAQKITNRISAVGFRLLNSNGIEKRTVFDYDISKTKNAYSRTSDRQIVVYRGLYQHLESDDELAAILGHEISHSVDSYNGGFRGFFTPLTYTFATKKYEYKADKKAVDYMVNAGYNPVAMIVVMSKSFPQARYDWWCSAHPLASKRMMEVYEYIYKKYPEYLVNNAYKNNMYYQNFLLTSKTERAKFQKKISAKAEKL